MTDRTDRTALVLAYACEPGKGSEPGAGWGMVMALNEFLHPVVLTRPDTLPPVEEYLAGLDGPAPEFIAVPEAAWGPWARRTNRILAFLAYLAWLRRARIAAEVLCSSRPIDVAHHITYSPYWLPTPVGGLPVPSIWGPVGGGVVTPRALHSFLGRRGRLVEWFDLVVVRALERFPGTRRTWREVSLRMLQNRETLARITKETSAPSVIYNHGVVHAFDYRGGPRRGDPYVVWLSPMESRKGPELAIRAMERAVTNAPMRMVGDGPERHRMEQLVADLGLHDRVEFLGRVPHDEAISLVANASVAVYTGMREEGGMALAEGLLCGTPTILLDNGGPAVMAAVASDQSRLAVVSTATADRTLDEIAAAIDHFTSTEPDRSKPLLDRDEMVQQLASIYDGLLEGAPESS